MKTTRPARIAENPPPEAPARSFLVRHRTLWPALLIVVAGGVAYANSLRGVFVFDDLQSIISNPAIRSFPTPARFLEDGRPVVFATLVLNYAWSASNPWSYHLVNFAVHALAGLALFGIVRRTLELPAPAGSCGPWAAPMALTIALLWMVHPLQTESVTYVIQRAESLMGLFYLSALYCLIRGHGSPHPRRWYVGAVASCLLGAGCKEVIVTLPVVALAYDALFLAGSWRQSLRRRWGLYLGLALCCGLAVFRFAFRAADAASTAGFGMKGVTPLQYALTEPGVILHYLRLSFWPWPLCLDYAWPFVRSVDDALPALLVVGVLLVVSLVGVVCGRRWAFPGLAFFCILAPTSSVVPIQDAAFEHRMYLPLAAVMAGAVIAGTWCWNRTWPLATGRWSSRALGGAVVLAVAGFCFLTVRRNADYRDEVVLWRQTVRCAPRNARAYGRLGAALVHRLPEDAPAGDEEALHVLDQAIALKPDDAEAWYNRGTACARIGRPEEALRDLDRAIALRPGDADAYYNRGNIHLDAKRYAEALHDYDRAIALEPDYADAWYNRANACAADGRPAEAVRDYSRAIELRPQDPDAYYNRAVVRRRLKHDGDALADFEMARKLGRPAPEELLRSLHPSAEGFR
ncbi:MAG: tetratricopeptide repeat protein [Candidatus Brocadiia bacterium]|jgi:regulator of sirC expression with transglutaminase-like and TPR domain